MPFCPVTLADFRQHAKTLLVKIADVPFEVKPKEFSTGSLGWNLNHKMDVIVNGKPVPCQIGMNITIIGSKGSAQP
jgi:hypothetical protein